MALPMGMSLEDLFWGKFSNTKDRDIFKVIEAAFQIVALTKPYEMKKKRSRLVSLMNCKSFYEDSDSSKAFAAEYCDNGGAKTDSQVDLRTVSIDKNDVEQGKSKASTHVVTVAISFLKRQSKLDSTKHLDAAKSALAQHSSISKSICSRPSESKSVSAQKSGISESVSMWPSKSKSISSLNSHTLKEQNRGSPDPIRTLQLSVLRRE